MARVVVLIGFLSVVCNASVARSAPDYFPRLQRPQATKVQAGQGGDSSIVMIVVCPSRPDHLSVYGYDKPTTEHLAKLADDGILFTRMYTNAPWTRAGSACLFTGMNGSRNGCQRDVDKLDPSTLTIAQRLRRAGYQTGGFVANGNASSLADLHRGFDVYRDSRTYWHKLASGAEVVDEAVQWIQTVKDKKFFALLFFVDPHDPYRAPAEYEQRYLKGFKGEPRRRAAWEYNNAYPRAEVDSMKAIYDAAYDYTDDQIGRFLGELDTLGLYQQATVLMTADHGEGFGEHGYFLHAHHFEDEIVRIPLIIKRPGFGPKGSYVDDLVQSIDVAPTLLEVAGVAKPKELPGLPLLSTLAGAGIPKDRVVISEYNEFGIRRAAIIRRDAKLILQRPADKDYLSKRLSGHLELLPTVTFDKEVMTYYRLDVDPFEKHNVWKPDDAVAADLLEKLRAFIAAAEPGTSDSGEAPKAGAR